MDEPRPSDEDVRAALATICDSQVFANKKMLPDLLTCIINHWLAGEEIKEAVLLIEVFKRSPDSDTGIVRSNAQNLRAALAEYYENEGRREEIRISVPRGGYNADIYYSATIRHRAELDRREAVLAEREREIERRHAEFDRKVEESEALFAKREALNAARHEEVDQKLAELEAKLIRRIRNQSEETEKRAAAREERIVENTKRVASTYDPHDSY